jgi:Tol biopolymer transport system component
MRRGADSARRSETGFVSRCLLVATVLSLAIAGSAAATFPGKNGDISFNRFFEADETLKLFTTTKVGSPPRLVTDFGPGVSAILSDWSPDGRKLAIDSDRSGQAQIWILDPDGTDARRLTDAVAGAFDPAWTPDGRKLAIDADFGDGKGIFLLPARSKSGGFVTRDQARRVTLNTDGGFDTEPQVSPDGRWIVFTRFSAECTSDETYDQCTTRLFRVRTDGSYLRQLTRVALNASAPDYHPSGRWIAFDTHDNFVAPDVGHIVVMRPDGSDKRVILRGDDENFFNNPSFSPDGRQVSFARWAVGAADPAPRIWTARADGRHPRQLLDTPSGDNKPDWGSAPHRHH